jgi:hypothetical protein
MSYTLGSITLPRPISFKREYIETGTTNNLLNGSTKKDIINRKEKFILEYTNLTQTEVAEILSQYELNTTRNFSVDETNLTIAETPVFIDIPSRLYNVKGTDYRESLTIVLTEVS